MRLPSLARLVLLLLAGLAALWWWSRPPARPPVPEPMRVLARTTPTPTAAPATPAPPGYRLAGVVIGDQESFAVIEAPSGTGALYRAGDNVPGLGRLARIEAERVLVESSSGPLALWLAPAATETPAAAATYTARTPPRRPPAAAGKTPGSTPSAAPG